MMNHVSTKQQTIKKVETEYKLELTEEEFWKTQNILANLKLSKTDPKEIKDYYFEVEKFDEKSWNFTRIRSYDEKFYEKTRKTWSQNTKEEKIRHEEESESSLGELFNFLKTERPLTMFKTRTDFYGDILGYSCIFSLDIVRIDNLKKRYFIECEVEVPEEISNSIRPEIRLWMLEKLNLGERPEGIGMFKLARELAGGSR